MKYEEAKINFFMKRGGLNENNGIHLWSIGHQDNKDILEGQDDDQDDVEQSPEEAKQTYELIRKMLDDDYQISESLTEKELETISDS